MRKKDMHKFFEKFSYEDYILFGLIVFSIIFYAFYISNYTQIPSPVYGGDYYRDRGFVNNIVAGNPIWSDAYYVNELQYYPYGIFVMEAFIVKITGLSVDFVFLYFPLVILALSLLTWYGLGLRLFKKKIWGLISAASFLVLNHSIGPKGGIFALILLVPAFFYFWIKYEQENKRIDSIFAGLILGSISMTYGGTFLAAISMFFMTIFCFYVYDLYKSKKFLEITLNYIKKYYLITIISIAISMIYFLPLIIKYHWHIVNDVPKWGDYNVDLLGPIWILQSLKSMFFNFGNIFRFLIGLVSLIGLIVMISAKKTKEIMFIILLFFSNIITTEHHIITRLLFNTWFSPSKLAYFGAFIPLFFTFGVMFIYGILKKEYLKKTLLILMVFILAITFVFQFNVFKNSQWEKVGRNDPTYINKLYSLGGYIENHLGKDEAILSNDETGFMLAVLSGRKVMLTRRTHASYFVDIDERIADASVAMYGKNINLSKEILKKYNVKYLYLDQYIFQSPMRTNLEFESYLKANNVNFTKVYDRYDIALPMEVSTNMDLILITPQNINKEFLNLWEPVYNVEVDGQIIGQLLKLKE